MPSCIEKMIYKGPVDVLPLFDKYIKKNNYNGEKHQKEGILWCKNIEINGITLNGKKYFSGILGDEMGLGKTAQMIGLILENFKLHTLIIVPRGLLEQWTETIRKTLNHEPLIYHGVNKKTVSLPSDLEGSAIVLSTYGTFSQEDKKGNFGLLHKMKWDRIIFDEAHHLRNINTKNNKAGKACKSSHKWLITGTPIQNGIKDFYGLCEIIGLDKDYYRRNVEKIAENLYLKRTKKEIKLNLSEMEVKKEIVRWETEKEKEFAEDVHYLLNFSEIKEMRENNVFTKAVMHHFALLHKARQTCIDTSLMEENLKMMKELNLIDKKIDIELINSFQSKLNAVCKKIIKNKNNGYKKLVFCHFLHEINKIEKVVRAENMNVKIFNGSTTISERENILNDKSIDIIILQINTGCEGLNLQEFNEIYFISAHWNPAIEEQAIARCHRMGQKKKVIVYKFEMRPFDEECKTKSLDNYIDVVQKRKRKDMKIIEKAENLLDETGDIIECAICLDTVTNKDYEILDCNHTFHKRCIVEWMSRNPSCPLCGC